MVRVIGPEVGSGPTLAMSAQYSGASAKGTVPGEALSWATSVKARAPWKSIV